MVLRVGRCRFVDPMIRRIAIAIILVLLVGGGLAGVKVLQFKTLMAAGKTFVQPPESVTAVQVRSEKWPSTLTAIGSVSAVQGVTITPEISGTVKEISFEGGAVVNRGDLLVKLDTSLEEAQLNAAVAQLELAKLNLDRVRQLRLDKTVSQSDLDTAESTLKQNQGSADAIRATIEKKTIRAPFAGRLGIRQANLGQFLDAGKPIVSLQALSPVYADFSLPQQELAQLKIGMAVRLTTDAYPGKTFDGKLTVINPDLDQTTRSVGLQATLENPEQLLRPGMFTRIEVIMPEEREALVIPITAVLSAPYGDSVFVVEPGQAKDGKAQQVVRQQFIRSGRTRGDFLTVESGLKPGQRVVGSGIFKLRNGMSVVENNELAPKTETAPRPSDS